MQNKDNEKSIIALKNLSSRFKLMPEFICGWDWSGFRRGLDDSIANDSTRERAKNLVDAANCYVKQTMPERIQVVNGVSIWLKNK